LTAVAPIVRFNDFAILATPAFDLAIVFSARTSSFDHARRTTFFFLTNFDSFFETALVSRRARLAMRTNN
jgi:hypothetical protein